MNKYSYLSRGVKPGSVFTYVGEAQECVQCERKVLCHGTLSSGFSYKVVRMTNGESIYCILRGEEVFPYEIALEPLILLAPKGRVKEGAVMELGDDFCKTYCGKVWECPVSLNRLVANRRVRVLEKLGAFDCPREELILIRVEVME
jgi:uncharacterized protein (UPF0179 family)